MTNHRRSTPGLAALVAGLVGLLVECPIASGIEVKPSERQAAPEEQQPTAGGVTWDGGAPEDEDDPEVAAAERAQLEARSATAEQDLREREGEERRYRYLPTTPLLREGVKRQREAARREAARADAGEVGEAPGTPAAGPESPQAPAGSRPDGMTLFVVIAALGGAAGLVVVRRHG